MYIPYWQDSLLKVWCLRDFIEAPASGDTISPPVRKRRRRGPERSMAACDDDHTYRATAFVAIATFDVDDLKLCSADDSTILGFAQFVCETEATHIFTRQNAG